MHFIVPCNGSTTFSKKISSTECDQVLRLSISIVVSFPQGQQLLTSFSSSFRHFYPFLYIPFTNVSSQSIPRPDITSFSSSFRHFYPFLYLPFTNVSSLSTHTCHLTLSTFTCHLTLSTLTCHLCLHTRVI
jgi:hypothetical protein